MIKIIRNTMCIHIYIYIYIWGSCSQPSLGGSGAEGVIAALAAAHVGVALRRMGALTGSIASNSSSSSSSSSSSGDAHATTDALLLLSLLESDREATG